LQGLGGLAPQTLDHGLDIFFETESAHGIYYIGLL